MAVMRSGTEGETEIVAVINIMYRTFKDKRSLYKNRGIKMRHKYLLYIYIYIR